MRAELVSIATGMEPLTGLFYAPEHGLLMLIEVHGRSGHLFP